jgi:hypothetical protein
VRSSILRAKYGQRLFAESHLSRMSETSDDGRGTVPSTRIITARVGQRQAGRTIIGVIHRGLPLLVVLESFKACVVVVLSALELCPCNALGVTSGDRRSNLGCRSQHTRARAHRGVT